MGKSSDLFFLIEHLKKIGKLIDQLITNLDWQVIGNLSNTQNFSPAKLSYCKACLWLVPNYVCLSDCEGQLEYYNLAVKYANAYKLPTTCIIPLWTC